MLSDFEKKIFKVLTALFTTTTISVYWFLWCVGIQNSVRIVPETCQC